MSRFTAWQHIVYIRCHWMSYHNLHVIQPHPATIQVDLLCNETTVGVARKVRIATVVTHELSHMWPLGLWSSSRAHGSDLVGTSIGCLYLKKDQGVFMFINYVISRDLCFVLQRCKTYLFREII